MPIRNASRPCTRNRRGGEGGIPVVPMPTVLLPHLAVKPTFVGDSCRSFGSVSTTRVRLQMGEGFRYCVRRLWAPSVATTSQTETPLTGACKHGQRGGEKSMVWQICTLLVGIAFLYMAMRGWDKDTKSGAWMFARLARWWLVLMGIGLLSIVAIRATS